MPNFLAALGQSQAVSGYLQGISELKQRDLQARQGEQAIKMNDLNMANTTQNIAIEKYKYDQQIAKDAADNRLISITDVLNTMGPKTQEAWKTLYGHNIETKDNVPYVRAKNIEPIIKGMQSPEVTAILDPRSLEDINDKLDKLNQLQQNLSTPDESGKIPKVDPQAMSQLEAEKAKTIQQRTDLINHLDTFNRRQDENKKEAERIKREENRIKLSMDFTPESVAAYLADNNKPLVKLPKEATNTNLGDVPTFEAETGTSPSLRGTKDYQKAIMNWRNKKASETKININMPTPQDTSKIAASMATGNYPPEMVGSRNGRNAIHSEVLRQYPKYNFSQSEANYKYMVNPSNIKTISYAKALLEPNPDTGLSRIDLLRQKADALSNINPLFVNKTLNYIANQGGRQQVVDFESLRNDLILEAASAFTGGVPTDVRTKIAMENLKSSNSPAQLKVALDNLGIALQSRQDAAQSVPYPWEVVRGEKTMGSVMKDIKDNTKGNIQSIHQELPSATQYKGKYATDTQTGKKYQSNGANWIEVK